MVKAEFRTKAKSLVFSSLTNDVQNNHSQHNSVFLKFQLSKENFEIKIDF